MRGLAQQVSQIPEFAYAVLESLPEVHADYPKFWERWEHGALASKQSFGYDEVLAIELQWLMQP